MTPTIIRSQLPTIATSMLPALAVQGGRFFSVFSSTTATPSSSVAKLAQRHLIYSSPVKLSPQRNFITVIRQYEKGVTLTLGKLTGCKEPGLRLDLPFIQKVFKVDMRTQFSELSKQQVITHDNISISVDAVVQFRVTDAVKATCEVIDYRASISELAQLKLREILSHSEINEVLHNRQKFNELMIEGTSEQVARWGIELISINIKDISFDHDMVRAMGKKAEALRSREAQIIAANTEVETSQKFDEAAKILEKNPISLELRKLETLLQIAREKNTIILFPTSVLDKLKDSKSA